MKFYSFSDLIQYTRIKKQNDYWISRLTDEVPCVRGYARIFLNYWKIPVSEEIWLLHHAMNKMDYLKERKNRWKLNQNNQ